MLKMSAPHQTTPRSARRQADRSQRHLTSPEHRRVPDLASNTDQTPIPFHLPHPEFPGPSNGQMPGPLDVFNPAPVIRQSTSDSGAQAFQRPGRVMTVDELRAAITAIPMPQLRRRRNASDTHHDEPMTMEALRAAAAALPPLQAGGRQRQLAVPISELRAAAAALPPLQADGRQRNRQRQQVDNQHGAVVRVDPIARQPFDKEKISVHDLGPMNVACPNCRAMHWMAERLSASSNTNPKFGLCCLSGKIKLPLLDQLPDGIRQLYVNNDELGKKFRKDVRQYNNALAMTSVGEDAGKRLRVMNNINTGHGPWVYKIQGALRHVMGSLLAPEGGVPRFAQLYVYDSQDALNYRVNANRNLDRRILITLQDEIHNHHRFVNLYKQAIELYEEMDQTANCRIALRYDPNTDRRTYNLPTTDTEVAVIIPGPSDRAYDIRDIIVFPRGGGLRRINELHPLYHSMHFVVLFPTGQLGWSPGIPYQLGNNAQHNVDNEFQHEGGQEPGQELPVREGRPRAVSKRSTVSQREYYAYRLMTRDNESDHLFRAGRLFQEFIVDAWAGVEQSILRWIALNQDHIRKEVYQGLVDTIQANPSSFTGGARDMAQCCQDALAINRFFGGADLFLTATANPGWPDVKRELLPGQAANDRPELVGRVFKQKMDALIKDIESGCLGRMVARVHTIEFQKRGLPHMHMIIFLADDSKLKTPEDVNKLLSAEFPDPDSQPELHELVKKCMVHGPCGSHNLNAPCMENGKCIRNFPKSFREETSISDNAYASYQGGTLARHS
jgi:hypothetical protein